jgi:hypothetical protein
VDLVEEEEWMDSKVKMEVMDKEAKMVNFQ